MTRQRCTSGVAYTWIFGLGESETLRRPGIRARGFVHVRWPVVIKSGISHPLLRTQKRHVFRNTLALESLQSSTELREYYLQPGSAALVMVGYDHRIGVLRRSIARAADNCSKSESPLVAFHAGVALVFVPDECFMARVTSRWHCGRPEVPQAAPTGRERLHEPEICRTQPHARHGAMRILHSSPCTFALL